MRLDFETKPRPKTHRAQQTQMVLGESFCRRANGADGFAAQILFATDPIVQLFGLWIEEEAIDRKIAPLCIGSRISKRDVLRMAAIPVIRLGAKGRNLKFMATIHHDHHAELSTDGDGVFEKLFDLIWQSRSHDVVILRLASEKEITHATTHPKRLEAGLVKGTNNFGGGSAHFHNAELRYTICCELLLNPKSHTLGKSVNSSNANHDIHAIVRQFQVPGEFVSAKPHGSGHINDTYCVAFDERGVTTRYVFQRINHHIFKNPSALMDNIQRVTAHLAARTAHEPDANRRVLKLVPANDGKAFHCDDAGNYWRAYVFIEGARTFDAVESPQQAFEAAKAFGHFQSMLSDLPAPRLNDTIPDFHHTLKRFDALERAIEADAVNRAAQAKAEIEFALKRKPIANVLLNANLPERITHNDTKINNVMLDDKTGRGICVVDLDTVMPGLAVYDFGDMVRSATNSAREDERDSSKVEMRFPMFDALVKGYLASASEFLTRNEKEFLAFSAILITFETGIRFLTDFLSGDAYFKVHREGQNLDRCRTQFKLMESIEAQESRMKNLVMSCV